MADTKKYFETALVEVDSVPPISNVFHKIMELTEGSDTARDELIRCVSLDQGVAAKTFQIINSAYYGIRQEISSLEVAVGLLGDKKVRDIAIMCATSGLLHSHMGGYGIPADAFWLHSVRTAFAARLLADKLNPNIRETAFAAGLLHDIGKLVVDRLVEESQKEILLKPEGFISPDYHLRESGLYGFDHCTVGFFLARKWNFSEELTAGISFHHFPDFEVAHREIVRITCAADLFAHLMDFEVLPPGLVASLEEEGRIPVELSHVEVEEIFTELKVEIDASQAFLGV
ncbi:MAG: HDOD domain-containing protein [Nitrospinaceae bacterium]|jgi:putative nucleotidyltransferase with HDIG domain|nr:HDOD domain-containing protein [Nitrospinaceae bacterium]MBT3435544.1 HDOD domain-containing protein [Nitrospinaceae bacterium]MBT3822512.1 HDOD domain-containing protein [Nitrospinaceae bacterium]MBT4095266.1 HDOD domain-containing protein [Nitrospinaceae bacterium]MBT4431835.1 HDOD domain-containing protein [Nitrospinaceae bacterium]